MSEQLLSRHAITLKGHFEMLISEALYFHLYLAITPLRHRQIDDWWARAISYFFILISLYSGLPLPHCCSLNFTKSHFTSASPAQRAVTVSSRKVYLIAWLFSFVYLFRIFDVIELFPRWYQQIIRCAALFTGQQNTILYNPSYHVTHQCLITYYIVCCRYLSRHYDFDSREPRRQIIDIDISDLPLLALFNTPRRIGWCAKQRYSIMSQAISRHSD